jgi:F-type H+-transporting ATPase subunit b
MSAWTLAFQVVNFLILAAVLRRFLFKPVAAMVARRQSEIEASSKEADSAKRAAIDSRARYEWELEKLRSDRESTLAGLRAQAAGEHDKLLQQARAEAAAVVESARAKIDQERRDAATKLADSAVGLAADLAKRLLEQVAGAGIAEALLQRVCDHLENMPAERIRSLREELAPAGASLEVATAPALAPEAEARWSKRITTDLATDHPVRFVADDGLVAGAELRFPHTTISFCWRDGLSAAREDLVHHADGR